MGNFPALNRINRTSNFSKISLLKIVILIGIILITYFSCSSQPTIPYICGDVDGSGVVDSLDAVFIIDHIFWEGKNPDPVIIADTDCSGVVNISDMVYIIAYLYHNGPEPCAGCPIDEMTELIGRPL